MIELKKTSELKGAARFGNCHSCGKLSNKAEIFRMTFSFEDPGAHSCINLCGDCLKQLNHIIETEIQT